MSIEAELALEKLLIKAFEQEAYRPQFLEQLLDAYIYILGSSSGEIDEKIEHTLTEGSQVHVKSWNRSDGTQVLPFFTSLEKLRQAIEHEENYLRLNTRSFFELTQGAYLVLNPNSEVAKEFYPNEVEGLLQGHFGPQPETYEYAEETQVLLSQPVPYPIKMISQVKLLLEKLPLVTAAYLSQMHDVKRDPEPTLVIGLILSEPVSEQQRKQVSAQVGQTASDALVQKTAVDLMFIDENEQEGLSPYFLNETQPFYIREKDRKKGFFAKLFS